MSVTNFNPQRLRAKRVVRDARVKALTRRDRPYEVRMLIGEALRLALERTATPPPPFDPRRK